MASTELPNIWMQCEGSSKQAPLATKAWRVVEGQHVNSTRKLVDSDAEQALLEALIDGVKPRVPTEYTGLHHLLFTPFRHPPLRNGSRFGTRQEPAIFYAAHTVETALAEKAYYRFVFLSGTAANLDITIAPLTAFQMDIRATRAVDLTRPPFLLYTSDISSKTSYEVSQRLGTEMRRSGVEALTFFSARDPAGGSNVALFVPAFAPNRPILGEEKWSCTFTADAVEMHRVVLFHEIRLRFVRTQFEVDGLLPSPAA